MLLHGPALSGSDLLPAYNLEKVGLDTWKDKDYDLLHAYNWDEVVPDPWKIRDYIKKTADTSI